MVDEKIIIVIEGGCLVDVLSNTNQEVILFDVDNMSLDHTRDELSSIIDKETQGCMYIY